MMDNALKKYALIVAGGSGTRMETEIPKQFLLLKGKPILMHTIEVFSIIGGIEIILVLPSSQFEYWESLCVQYSFQIKHKLVAGGETRFHSVRNGLQIIDAGIVAIHDGVRPIISKQIIEQSFTIASEKGNAIAAVKLKDTIREVKLLGGSRNVNRNNYYLIQTPQTFQLSLIKEAYNNATHYNFTDDAGVLEEVGGNEINLIEGDYKNIKITTPEDLQIAENFISTP